MDLRQLQAFIAVVENGGFTAAAKATHTVQSNISTHIARLEKELDTTLIDRNTGQPTEEGKAVLVRARRILTELESMKSDISSLRDSPKGTVRVGMIGTTARWLTPLLAQRVNTELPDIKIVIADGTTRSLETSLSNGDLDFCLLGLPLDMPEITTEPLFTEENILVGPANHKLTNLNRTCKLEEVAEYPILLAAPGTSYRQEIDESFIKEGIQATPLLEIDGLRLLASLGFQNFGLAIVPATAATEQGSTWQRIPVEGLNQRTVGLARRKQAIPTMAAQVTAGILKEIVESQASTIDGIDFIKESFTNGN